MDLIDQHHLIEAVFHGMLHDGSESEADVTRHNGRIRQLAQDGLTFRWEPLYDAKGYSVAKRIGLFHAPCPQERRHLLEERFYERGRIEGSPWRTISKETALRYRNRDGKIMAGW